MSECVVRMPNPDDCIKCAVRFICSPYEDYWQQDTRRKPTPGQKGCRILSVLPENHGRLVDADEMYKKSEAFCNQCRQGKHDCEQCNYIVAQGYMYKSPTIVPAERSET